MPSSPSDAGWSWSYPAQASIITEHLLFRARLPQSTSNFHSNLESLRCWRAVDAAALTDAVNIVHPVSQNRVSSRVFETVEKLSIAARLAWLVQDRRLEVDPVRELGFDLVCGLIVEARQGRAGARQPSRTQLGLFSGLIPVCPQADEAHNTDRTPQACHTSAWNHHREMHTWQTSSKANEDCQ